MSPFARHPHFRPAGFSLVEIMVGMVIGMLGIIVMMQVFALAEGQKRTTTGGNDAQTNGAIAMAGLQRDLRQAGFGISDVRIIGCDLLLPNGVTLPAMAPVIINPPALAGLGDLKTDTLLVFYGNDNSTPQGDLFQGYTNAPPSMPSNNIYPLTTATSFNAGDYVIAVPWADDVYPSSAPATPTSRPVQGTSCGPLLLDKVIAVTPANVTVKTGVTASTMGNNSLVFNLGAAPKILAYAIRKGNLERCDFFVPASPPGAGVWNDCSDPAKWTQIAGNIVSMRAQYGRDTTVLAVPPLTATMDGIVDVFDQATPALQTPTTPATPTTRCGWMRISAVRLVLVGRSDQYEYDKKQANGYVTCGAGCAAPTPTWIGSTAGNPAGSGAASIDLSSYADWQHYRYKVFQTVVPLRNVTWQAPPNVC